jgi:pimeloyl-ACP methyl ester carboxylesterase
MPAEISEYRVEFGAAVDDLRARLARTRWPERETVDDWSQGLPLAYARELCEYWADGYDFAAAEQRLNAFPQYRTALDGGGPDALGIHFLHVRSPHPDAFPVVMTHGWPGSVVEFHKVIGPLTDPTAYGGDASDALHLVVPSLPGYGFSDKPARTGWNIERIGRAWPQLMARLGYDRYGAQGGDWGAMATTSIGQQDPDHVAGIHVQLAIVRLDPSLLTDLTEREQSSLDSGAYYSRWGSGYSTQQASRPQTLGYGLVDSPAAQCAWIVEKFWDWTDCDGHPENVVSRDDLLDNVMLYWIPATGASSARLYWESFHSTNTDPVDVPSGVSVFPKEIFRPSQRWVETRFTDLRYYNERDKGGHFAAFEQPDAFVDEVRAFFRLVRAEAA